MRDPILCQGYTRGCTCEACMRDQDVAAERADRALESAGNYDEKCDMAGNEPETTAASVSPKPLSENEMRETGFEPASPKAPDPKARPDSSTPDSSGSTEPLGATERQAATPDDAESTTDSATSDEGGSEDEPPSRRAVRPVPILARTPESACGNCGQPAYWSIEEFAGLNVLVSVTGDGSIAPTRYHEGVGIPHVCPPRTADTRRRQESPL